MILHLLLVGTFDMSWYFIIPENWASRQCPGRDLRTCYKMLRDVSIRICLALGSFHILPPPRYHNMPQKSLFETRTSRIISHISPSSPTTRSTVRWAPWTYASMPQFTKWLTPQETTGDQRDLGSPRRVIGGTAQHLHDLNALVVYFVLLSPEAFQFIPENVEVLRAAKAYSRLTWTQCKARSCNLLQGFDVFFLARLVTGRHYDCSIEPPRPTLWRAMLWIEPAQLHAPAFMWSIDIILWHHWLFSPSTVLHFWLASRKQWCFSTGSKTTCGFARVGDGGCHLQASNAINLKYHKALI